jgi:hypothetical protein
MQQTSCTDGRSSVRKRTCRGCGSGNGPGLLLSRIASFAGFTLLAADFTLAVQKQRAGGLFTSATRPTASVSALALLNERQLLPPSRAFPRST